MLLDFDTVLADCVAPKYVFVDWAGDPGFKFRHRSSCHLVVVAVFAERYEAIQQAVRRFRRERQVSESFYLHYTDASNKLRLAFCSALSGMPFAARIVIVNKAALSDTWRRMGGQGLIEHFVAEAVVGASRESVEDAVLIFDGPRRETRAIRGIRVAISRLLEEREMGYHLKKVSARPAVEEDGLQIADMLAGAALDSVAGAMRGCLAQLGNQVEILYVPGEKNRPG
ncbi:MAG: hypothetical protein CVU38_16345 [Chloroflexi bacterium HGW-Chloroflexi-1]|nr:MAG: hypothetical protein CVU38_16345 [Chloroflexi bacterium HGW-Chloroflexi-1]